MLKKAVRILSIVLLICLLINQISFAKYLFNKELKLGEINIQAEGVYAKVYDTNADNQADTLIINNTPEFSYEGKLIQKYNEDNNQKQGDTKKPLWDYFKPKIEKVVILSKIKPTNISGWFEGSNLLTQIENIENIDTSQVQKMQYVFYNCSKLTSLNVLGFNTENVTDMNRMFFGCSKLTQLDLSSFDTSKVTNMEAMFNACVKVQKIYVSNKFRVDKVTESANMFYRCSALAGDVAKLLNSSYVNATKANYIDGYLTLKQ